MTTETEILKRSAINLIVCILIHGVIVMRNMGSSETQIDNAIRAGLDLIVDNDPERANLVTEILDELKSLASQMR